MKPDDFGETAGKWIFHAVLCIPSLVGAWFLWRWWTDGGHTLSTGWKVAIGAAVLWALIVDRIHLLERKLYRWHTEQLNANHSLQAKLDDVIGQQAGILLRLYPTNTDDTHRPPIRRG